MALKHVEGSDGRWVSVERSDSRWLSVGDKVKSPEFGGSGTITRIDQTPQSTIKVTVSFKDHTGNPGVKLDANREHAFYPNQIVRE